MLNVWLTLCNIMKLRGSRMTERQWNVFQGIIEAYRYAEDEYASRSKAEFASLWYEWKGKAERDELRTIKEIAALFFLAMLKFGE